MLKIATVLCCVCVRAVLPVCVAFLARVFVCMSKVCLCVLGGGFLSLLGYSGG